MSGLTHLYDLANLFGFPKQSIRARKHRARETRCALPRSAVRKVSCISSTNAKISIRVLAARIVFSNSRCHFWGAENDHRPSVRNRAWAEL